MVDQLTRVTRLLGTLDDYQATATQKDVARAELRKMRNVVPQLIPKLQGTAWTDREERIFASKALGEIGDASAVPALIAVLEVGNSNDDTGRQASKALGKIGDPQAIEPLLAIFRKASSSEANPAPMKTCIKG
jgi:HEAT repeat protein